MSSASAMAADYAPITIKEAFTLPSIGINPQFIGFMHVTMESDKYICVQETAPRNNVVIIDMSMPNQPLRRLITADSVLMNPKSGFIALKVQLPGTTQDHLQIIHLEVEAKMKSHSMPEQIVFWKWVTPKILGLVTQTSVYHWPIEGDLEPVKMFERTANLASNQIINYRCDPAEKWLFLIGITPGSPERPQLLKGNMQLFSVDQQHSQALEAHVASFATFKVSGNENPSTLICFASKTTNAGQVTSKLHVIELGAQPGKPTFTEVQTDLLFPPDFADDFPVAMQISHKYGLIYVITYLGLLFVYDLETSTRVYINRISPDPIFLTSEASSVGGFYAVNRRGQVLLATVNEATIVHFVSSQLNNLELAVNLAKRGNLPADENLVVQLFQELFSQTKYKEAAVLAAESHQGILRTPDTIAKLQSVPDQTGQIHPLFQYYGILLTRGKLNAFESLELSQLVVNQNKKNLLENWLAEDKLECSEELGDLVKTVDNDLALKIYIKARASPKVVAAFAEQREFDKIPIYSKQFVQRFQELFSQSKYKEAVEFVAESPQGILRTPDTLAKFRSVPVQTGQTPPLELYFWILLNRGKLNAFETLEMSQLVVNKKKMLHNKKYLLENWLAEDKLECSEELGDLVKTIDNDLAQKIYIKARATSKVVAAFAERQEFDKILIYSKQEKEERLDGDADEDERRAKNKSFSMQRNNASFYSVEKLILELASEKAKRYSYDEIANFTSIFCNEIGSGAFGIVYKGQFSDGTKVAVKVLKMHDFKVLKMLDAIHDSFLTEIRTMGKTDHKNLIKLIGFCLEENKLALVYEYMENGSLDKILYKKPLTLEWDKLYDIAVELANALVYLHPDCGDQIIHHDIKASNVLLDSNYLPKLSDFGLANLMGTERTHLTLSTFRGTRGYVAPEVYSHFSPITSKCDVYSFAMLLFEILGKGKNNRTDIWFPRHVWNKFNSGTLDDLITECGISENDRKKATILSLVALWCAQHTPEARPPMSTVATVLKNEILVKTPPNPFLPSDPPDTMSPA